MTYYKHSFSCFIVLYETLKYHNAAAAAKSLQSCPTLCDPIDGSPPGPSIPGILQARTHIIQPSNSTPGNLKG